MLRTRLDHVALLVRSVEGAVKDYQDVLKVLDPENSVEIVWEDSIENGYKYRSATFVSKNGGTVLQLIESESPKDKELLSKRGECVHHLEFCSTDVEDSLVQLKAAKIPLVSDALSASADKPWHKSVLLSPQKTHGVLVKVASKYKVRNGKWVP
jgi:hypothetical protein